MLPVQAAVVNDHILVYREATQIRFHTTVYLRPSFEPKHGLSVRCLKYAFLKAGFNSADVGGLGSLAQIAEAAYVSMIG